MAVLSEPQAQLSLLPRVDGSARYAHAGYTATASVNGPIEAGRRDEDPYEAVLDVVVRPAAGSGGTRERYLETLLKATLKQLILVQSFPRSMIQIVLQIETTPENDYVNTKLMQPQISLPIIPALIQAAVLALLSAAVPLRATATSTVVSVMPGNDGAGLHRVDPSPRQLEEAQSVHLFAFSSLDGLLLAESEGDFSFDEWNKVLETARRICCGNGGKDADLDAVMGEGGAEVGTNLRHFVRAAAEARVADDLEWKNGR